MPNKSKKEPPLNPDEHGLDKTTEHSKNAERKRRDNGKHKGVIMPIPATSVELPGDYADFLTQIKQRVKIERLKVVLSANAAQILMYWDIGHEILRKQEQAGWGAKVIDRLACDLKESFPEMNGFSARNPNTCVSLLKNGRSVK